MKIDIFFQWIGAMHQSIFAISSSRENKRDEILRFSFQCDKPEYCSKEFGMDYGRGNVWLSSLACFNVRALQLYDVASARRSSAALLHYLERFFMQPRHQIVLIRSFRVIS